MADRADRIAAYVGDLTERLEQERRADQAENEQVLATCSPKELQLRGLMLAPLTVGNVSTGLGGRR